MLAAIVSATVLPATPIIAAAAPIPSPIVTATSSQVIARNYNSLAGTTFAKLAYPAPVLTKFAAPFTYPAPITYPFTPLLL